MSSRTKAAGRAASLAVSLGVLAAIVVPSASVVASNPERAYGEIVKTEVTSTPTTTSPLPSTLTTASATPTASIVATVTPIKMVMVPALLGKTKAQAVKRLKSRQLKARISRGYSSKRAGTVIGQTPCKKRRKAGTTVRLVVARRWPSGFKTKAQSDKFWRPYVTARFREVQRNKRYRGHHSVATNANVNMALKAIWGESRGAYNAGLKHRDGYLGLLQMNRGYGSTAQRLDPLYSITRMGRGIKSQGAGWARSRWSTI